MTFLQWDPEEYRANFQNLTRGPRENDFSGTSSTQLE